MERGREDFQGNSVLLEIELSKQRIKKALEAGNIPVCINETMMFAIANRATDIHLMANKMFMRIDRDLYRIVEEIQNDLFITLIRGFYALTKGQQINPLIFNRGSFVYKINRALFKSGKDKSTEYKDYNKACRITVAPAVTGKMAANIRLRDPHFIPPLDQLGLMPEDLEMIHQIVIQQYRGMGVFLVTGPPNSGKSTLLLSILKEIYAKAEGKVSVATLEDPVEIQIKDFVQFSINPDAGMTFEDAVEQVLTYDQNILLIGEIRDQASAKVVFRASSSGHLAFSTLHARDTLHAFERLRDLEVRASEMSGHLLGIVSQRLLRRLCPKCKEVYDATEDIKRLKYPGFEGIQLYRPKKGGCDYCKGRGIKGMVTILEILDTTQMEFRNALSEGKVPMSRLLFLSNRQQMRTLFDSAIKRIKMGDISIEEAISTVHR